jgi:vesicle coat complex subunit
MVFDKELKIFYCNFNDPIYVKREKLDVLVRLANQENIQSILHELKDYTNEVDVEFVKKSKLFTHFEF